MKLNTVIKLPDGRIGTTCYNHLDGWGGVWGEHWFPMPDGGFGDELPEPQFMMRGANIQDIKRKKQDPLMNAEFLGEPEDVNFEIIRQGDNGVKP